MFSDLKLKIDQLTKDQRFSFPQKVSRTFFFQVSPGRSDLKDFVKEFLPIPNEISPLYPWFIMEDLHSFSTQVQEKVKLAFEAGNLQEIVFRGFSILDSINQVIVIADLSEKGVFEKLIEGSRVIESELKKIIGAKIPVYWIAILVLRKPPRENFDQEVSEKVTKISNLVKGGSEKESTLLFQRIFLLDISNSQGTLISKQKDQDALICHLLYFLTIYPLVTDSPDQYSEWLVKTEEEGSVSGFSGFSLVFPINQILESVTLFKSVELMREALLSEYSIHHHSFYLNSFLQKTLLLSLEEVEKTLSEDPDFPLKDPLSHLPDFFSMRPEDYIETMDALDASLPNISKENEEIMNKLGEKRLREWNELLEDHIESIIRQEKGGLLTAEKLLKELKSHLEKLLSQKEDLPLYEDPATRLLILRQLVQFEPKKESIYARFLVLAATLDIGISSLPITLWIKLLYLMGLPIMILFLAAFVSHSNRQKIENQILILEKILRGKWRAFREVAQKKAAKKLIENFLNIVDKLQMEISRASSRLLELLNYFQELYFPDFPEELAFRKCVVKEREEILNYRDLCKADIPQLATNYIERNHPLSSWKRLSLSVGLPPNKWELHIMEMAAIQILPDCGDIINLSILSYLQSQNNFGRFWNLIIRGIQPFLILRPGASPAELKAFLENGDNMTHPLIRTLEKELLKYFNIVHKFKIRSTYRLSIFGFMDDVKIEEVLIR